VPFGKRKEKRKYLCSVQSNDRHAGYLQCCFLPACLPACSLARPLIPFVALTDLVHLQNQVVAYWNHFVLMMPALSSHHCCPASGILTIIAIFELFIRLIFFIVGAPIDARGAHHAGHGLIIIVPVKGYVVIIEAPSSS